MTWQEIIKRSPNTILVENSKGRIKSSLKAGLKPYCVATDAKSMALALEDNPHKEYSLWLDYDLTRIWKIGKRSNSLEIIKIYKDWLKESGCKLIVIHSWNPWGRLILQRELGGIGVEIILKRHWRVL